MRVFLLFLLALTVTAALIDHETKEEFKEFLHKFKKHYDDPVRYAKRLGIYAKNKVDRALHNLKFKNGMVGWEEELNQFADQTKEEFLKRLGLLPGPPPNNTDAIPASVYYAGVRSKRGNIDWRAAGKVGSVKEQGRCGSCWAFSATAVVETCVAIMTGPAPDLSEQIFQDCLETNRCSPGGGHANSALDLAKAYGQSFEKVGYVISGKGQEQLEVMLQGGAVAVGLYADALQFYSRGVIDAPSSDVLNHAVTVVALTTNCDNKSSQCWVAKNSWGPGWGENGYFRVVKGKNAMGISDLLNSAVRCSADSPEKDGLYGPIEYAGRSGYDIDLTKAANAQDCQTACAKRDDCYGWAFDTCGDSCWFKKAGSASYPRGCRASGIVNHQLKIFFSSIGPVYLVMVFLEPSHTEHHKMTDLKRDFTQWQESNEENPAMIELLKADGDTLHLSIGADEQRFQILKTTEGTFKFTTTSNALKKEWLSKVTKETTNKKKLDDILDCATETFLDVMEEAEEEEEQEDEDKEMFDFTAPIKKKEKEESADTKEYLEIGSPAATMRLIRDLKSLNSGDTKSLGFSAEPTIDTRTGLENLYHWKITLFGFDPSSELANDMKRYEKTSQEAFITMEMRFSKDYPYAPPFVRVVKPRFAFRTGHVTIGGSICMDLLTNAGWASTNDIESILIQIRAELLSGNARLDEKNTTPYTEQEAWDAFKRVATSHGWNTDGLNSGSFNHIKDPCPYDELLQREPSHKPTIAPNIPDRGQRYQL
ncbi:hypothetical protein PROFUN_05626 [Planoprotostelium fungivorum]|uniref:Uncharacterized protein n=1 Tax=Planoprotostelium fungivorum TaxID=1890364 RepID=A0A2P6MUC2_9EUKA|nr:hypothetical protein PROFUN_05626 [Planoprotostelium fungivorum]